MIDEHDIDAMPTIDAMPEEAEPARAPDPDALSSVLGAAIAEIDADGGREANLLTGVIGKAAFARSANQQRRHSMRG